MNLTSRCILTAVFMIAIIACKGNGGGSSNSSDPNPNFPTNGLPDQNSMDMSASILNPEGLNLSGVTTNITVRVADHLNDRSVFDGKLIFFSAEGGSIENSCELTDGVCTVIWASQEPRPADGRATITAWTDGNESFTDNNANGLFDDGDTFPASFDIPEAFRDDNFNGSREIDEPFQDFDGDGSYDLQDSLYSGADCAHSTLCAPNNSAFIFRNLELVMAGSSAVIGFTPSTGPITLPATVTVTIADINGNPMPANSSFQIDASVGSISGPSISSYPSTNGPPLSISFLITGEASGDAGLLTVEITSPGGTISYASIGLQD